MLELLRELVEIESPTYSPGVRAVAARIGLELESLGVSVTIHEGAHLVAELPGAGEPLLLLGHADTVWPVGTLDSMPFRVDGDRAYGPGVYDMKACLVVLLEAIRLAGAERRALRVFVTADEEMGSPTGRAWIEQAADGVAAALVVEPPGPDGNLKTARKGLGRFRLTVKGRPAHAGTHRAEGASAIEELAHQVLALHDLNDEERGVSSRAGRPRASSPPKPRRRSTCGSSEPPTGSPSSAPSKGSGRRLPGRHWRSAAAGRGRRSSRPPVPRHCSRRPDSTASSSAST